MEQRISVLTLGVRDLGRARAFYEALGWATRAAPDDDVVFFRSGGWGRMTRGRGDVLGWLLGGLRRSRRPPVGGRVQPALGDP